MTVVLDTSIYKLSKDTVLSVADLRVKEYEFGDGYSQTEKDGINAEIEEWNLVFLPQDVGAALTLVDILRNSKNGTSNYLEWAPIGDSTKYWKLKGAVSVENSGGVKKKVSATVKRAYI
ncbi:MAG TPA: hypothetical protein DHV36_15755 [Desulfobacteraceae bacterium]|nr:hypothetical protein [Desulfobacteraceae bacterium]